MESAGIDYMLTGSFVSSFYGEARATHDIDVVVHLRIDQVSAIARAFPSDEYAFDDVAAANAIPRQDMFQLTEWTSGDKVDFWVLKSDAFDRSAFGRRQRQQIAGISAFLPTPEDLILQKLRWAQEYESEKQYTDALGVYELQHAELDIAYLKTWVDQLDLTPIWQRLTSEAQPLEE